MSEPESTPLNLPPWWPRAAGAGLVVVALAMRLFAPDGPMALVSWGAGMFGLAFALFGVESGKAIVGRLAPAKPETTPVEPSALQPVRILGFGSATIGCVGVGWVISDIVGDGVHATNAWWVVVAATLGLVATGIWSATLDQEATPLRVPTPETPNHRRAIGVGVAVALLAQIAIPSTYYFSEDRFDERFAWRMFSDVRVYTCRLGAYDVQDGQRTPVRLPSVIHVAWINTMRRSREGVLQRYLTWRCETEEIDGAQIVNQCRTPENEAVPPVVRALECGTGEITAVGVE